MKIVLSSEKRKHAISISDLGSINFIPRFMIEHLSSRKLDYTDELSFAIILLEMMLGTSSERFYKEIDFENGNLSDEVKRKIEDPVMAAII